MKKILVSINVLLLFSLLGLSGCATAPGSMRYQQHHKFWSDQVVADGTYAKKEQVGTYNGKEIKSIGQRRLQSSHIV